MASKELQNKPQVSRNTSFIGKTYEDVLFIGNSYGNLSSPDNKL
jgi:hypothetical protein